MYQRIATGVVGVAALLFVVMLDAFIAGRAGEWGVAADLLSRGSVIPLLFAMIMVAAVVESSDLMRRAGCRPHTGLAAVWVVVLMVSPWLCAGRMLGDAPADVEGFRWQVIWLSGSFVCVGTWHLKRGVDRAALADLGSTILLILYLGLLPSFAVQLRSGTDMGDPHDGAWIILIVLAIALATDVFALFAGMAFGRHPLAPAISPQKTVEGAIGGILGSILVALLIYAVARLVGSSDAEIQDVGNRSETLLDRMTGVFDRMSLIQVIVLGAVLSIMAQVGDLFESQLKRSAQVKDSSAVIPGMGGVLDVIDGVVFAVPAAWVLLSCVWGLV
ncbi:MAG: phosphatidate cytidylyltransferase [Phycisphaerales bacterium]|nr:phosphatidate cytidylyltransferase [Phycisphaerales bacterium]